MARKKDDSNSFVVSVTAFNHASRDPLTLVVLLAALLVYGFWGYEMFKRRG
jgi:hypothetical protein